MGGDLSARRDRGEPDRFLAAIEQVADASGQAGFHLRRIRRFHQVGLLVDRLEQPAQRRCRTGQNRERILGARQRRHRHRLDVLDDAIPERDVVLFVDAGELRRDGA
jgi:hypothetical protein